MSEADDDPMEKAGDAYVTREKHRVHYLCSYCGGWWEEDSQTYFGNEDWDMAITDFRTTPNQTRHICCGCLVRAFDFVLGKPKET